MATEKQLLERIRSLARKNEWRIYHTHNSRYSERGFPDLTLVRGSRLIFAELKADKGVIRPGQMPWLHDLAHAGAEAYLWRPSHWDSGAIQQILT